MTTRFAMISALFCALQLFNCAEAIAQGALREKQRMAQAFEHSGDMRNASRLWQEIFSEQPTNDAAYGGVVRTLLALKQEAALLPVVEQYAKANKHPESMLLAGTLSWKIGKAPEADSWWTAFVQTDETNPDVWFRLGREYASLTLHQKAIDAHLKARDLSGNPNESSAQLSALYAAMGSVEKGAEEILRLYALEGDVQQTKGLLSSLMTTPENTAFLKGVLKENRSSKYSMLVLRQWFARETRDWNSALELSRALDDERNARGQELLMFADGARMDGQYDVAIKAYSEVLALSNVATNTSLSAAYGSTRTLEQKLKLQGSSSRDDALSIIERYSAIVKQYPQHPISAEALLKMARLTDEDLKDPVGALAILQRLANTYRGTTSAADGVLLLSSIYAATGRLDLAESVLADITNMPSRNNANQRELALLRKADLLLFRGQTDSARTMYVDLVSRPASPAANDALERSLLLTLAQDDSAAVVIFVQGLLSDFQRRAVEASDHFIKASEKARDPELRDRSLFEAARTRLASGDDAAAQPLLKTLTERTPESLYGDRAMFLLAEILERGGNRKGALEMLTNLIVQYPRSIHVPEARTRIRRLRGDV